MVTQAQAGDVDLHQELCNRFEGLVAKLSYRQHLRSIAEEAQAVGHAALVEGILTYRADSGVPVEGYLAGRITYALWNLFKKERRRWQIEQSCEGEEEETGNLLAILAAPDNVEAEVLCQEEYRELAAALEHLPKRQQEAIRRTFFQDQSLQVAAQGMGISLQAVHSLRKRGLRQLKEYLVG